MNLTLPNPIAFSTLACPEWLAETVIERAAAFGYDALEWRGGEQGHVPPHMPPPEVARLRRRVVQAGLASLAVTAYSSFTSASAADQQSNVDHLRRCLDLAAGLGAGYVRVFLGELPPGLSVPAAMPRLVAGLEPAVAHARQAGVMLAIEPHDDFARPASIAPLLQSLAPDVAGAIWDVGNAYAAGEEVDESHALLAPRLAYVQVKDGVGRGSRWRLCAIGQGEAPLAQAFELLLAGPTPFRGAFSVEWERAWHPELEAAEVALPAALRTVRALLVAHASRPQPNK